MFPNFPVNLFLLNRENVGPQYNVSGIDRKSIQHITIIVVIIIHHRNHHHHQRRQRRQLERINTLIMHSRHVHFCLL